MTASFRTFADDVLVKAGEKQRADKSYSVDLYLVLASLDVDPFDGWNEQVIPHLSEYGWAEDDSTLDERRLRVTGSGYARIEELLEERRPKLLRERIAQVNRSDWIALGALVVSILSWLKA